MSEAEIRAGEMEQSVVAKAAAGDEAAFAQILEGHRDMVYTICFRTLGNAHDAEEAFQDTFVSAFRNLPRFRGDSKLSTWLYRIAVNRCRDFMSAKSTRQARETASLDDEDNAGAQDALRIDEGASADAAETVREALAAIDKDYAIAINLHCIMGYSYDEAGEIMGVPGGTVKTYVHRGKESLREIIAGGSGL
jgi:RNA polymerase sigma-70 factor (ECF subfamily)